MPRKKSPEEFVKEVYNLVGDEYEVLGEYLMRNKIQFQHNICGRIYRTTPEIFLQGSRCPKCAEEKRRKTHEKFVQEVFDLVGDEYEVVGKYIGDRIPIKIWHNKCSSEFIMRPSNFLQGNRCSKCRLEYINSCNQKRRKTHEKFVQEVFDLVGDEYEVVGKYIGGRAKLEFLHTKCNRPFTMKANNMLFGKGNRCKKCYYDSIRKTHEKFVQEVFDLVGDEYKVIGKYIGGCNRVQILHKKCGTMYLVTPTNFLSGNRCPYCRESKGEKWIADYLKNRNISFKRQVRFKDCRNIRPLAFDFQILTSSNNLILLEYDGELHFKPWHIIKKYKDRLVQVQYRDQIKNQYCQDNDILLYRISYKENIEQRLEEILKETGMF